MTLDYEFWKSTVAVVALASVVIVSLAGIAGLLFRTPHWRKAIWQSAVVGLFLILAMELTGTGGGLFVQLLPTRSENADMQRPTPTVLSVETFSEPITFPPVVAKTVPAVSAVKFTRPSPVVWPVCSWLAITFVLLGRIVLAQFGLGRFRNHSAPVEDPEVVDRVNSIATRLGIRRSVRVIESDKVQAPIAFGIVRKVVGIPRGFQSRFTREERDSMFTHELAHLSNNDPFWRLIIESIAACWWWNPLVWWARRNWIIQSELAADEASHSMPDGPELLASCLVKIGRDLSWPRSVGWIGMAGYRSQLGKRVERLLKERRTDWRCPSRTGQAMLRAFSVIALLCSGLAVTGIANPGISFPEDTAIQKVRDSWNQSLLARTVALTQTSSMGEPQPIPQLASNDGADVGVPSPAKVTNKEVSAATKERGDVSSANEAAGEPPPTTSVPSEDAVVPPPPIASPAAPDIDHASVENKENVQSPQSELFTRSYKVEPNVFKQELQRFVKTKRPDLIEGLNTDTNAPVATDTHTIPDSDVTESFKQSRGWEPMNGQLFMGKAGMDQQLANLALVEYLKNVGVEIAAPKMVYFNDRTGMILVRATTEDLEIVQMAVAVINEAPVQVTIETRFVELSETDARALGFNWILENPADTVLSPGVTPSAVLRPATDGNATLASNTTADAPELFSVTGILTDPQFRTVMTALDQHQGVDMMFAPRVTTLSGRQTQIKSVNVQTIITEVTTNESGLYPVTTPMEFGPVLDVIPRVSADNTRIEMTVIATLSQFLGYDDPGAVRAVYQPDKSEDAVTLPTPKPRYDLRQASTVASVWDGQTIVLGGMTQNSVEITKTKVPVLGSIPLLGRVFRSEKRKPVQKTLIVFITPTIIDPAGNRVQAKK